MFRCMEIKTKYNPVLVFTLLFPMINHSFWVCLFPFSLSLSFVIITTIRMVRGRKMNTTHYTFPWNTTIRLFLPSLSLMWRKPMASFIDKSISLLLYSMNKVLNLFLSEHLNEDGALFKSLSSRDFSHSVFEIVQSSISATRITNRKSIVKKTISIKVYVCAVVNF